MFKNGNTVNTPMLKNLHQKELLGGKELWQG